MGFNIQNGGAEKRGIVFESTDASVAMRTEQSADFTSNVAVIDGEMDCSAVTLASGRFVADGADAVLVGQHPVVVGESDAVLTKTSLANPFFSGELFFKQFCHIWKRFNIGDKFGKLTSSGPRVFVAQVKVDLHSPETELLSTIAAWSEFPATRAKTNNAPDTINFGFAGLRTLFSAGFAFPFDAVSARSVGVEIGSQSDVLAPRTKFFIWSYWRDFVANNLPVAAQFILDGFLSAEAALDCFLT